MQPSTLVRFAQAFGYSGFSDLQDVFKAHLADGGRSRDRWERASSSEAARLVDGFIGSSTAALAGVRDRLDLTQFEIMSETLFNLPIFKGYGALIAAGKFTPAGFAAPLGLKDVKLALTAGDALQVPLPLASLLRDRFLALLAQGGKDLDDAFRWLCKKSNGGDFLILRAIGDDAYNLYVNGICKQNSVATLVIPDTTPLVCDGSTSLGR